MIRILHTSDWHLGKRLERFSRHEEQVAVLNEIIGITEDELVDVVLIAGDLFDTFNPPAESLNLFYKTLKRLSGNGKRAVIAIAGNHDMPERIEAPDPLARECGIVFAGFPDSSINLFGLEDGFKVTRSEPGFMELQLVGNQSPLRIILTPYANEIRLKRGLTGDNNGDEIQQLLRNHWMTLAENYCDDQGVNILLAHLLFMNEGDDIPEEPEDERPINHVGGARAICTSAIPELIQYAALGHLHRKQTIANQTCPVVYSGSPLPYSFSEAGQKKHVLIIEAEPARNPSLRAIELKSGRRLVRKRFENTIDAEEWLKQNPDTLVELTLVTQTFLSGADRRRLQEVHDGIVALIPEVVQKDDQTVVDQKGTVKIHSDIQELFSEYFQFKKSQQPDEALKKLFAEVLSEAEENE
jgi:exonuclease SbcD